MLRTITRLTFALSALCWALSLSAQNTLTFGAQTTTGDGSVVPVLNWSTAPAAQTCTGSGPANWAGAKTPTLSGTQTLPAIMGSATYTMLCTWAADNQAVVLWTNASKNTDGSNYTDPLSVRLKYTFNASLTAGPTCAAGETCLQVAAPTNTFTITGISQVGTMRLVAFSQNQRMVFSDGTSEVTKTFAAGSQTKSVALTVNPVGNPPSNLSIQ